MSHTVPTRKWTSNIAVLNVDFTFLSKNIRWKWEKLNFPMEKLSKYCISCIIKEKLNSNMLVYKFLIGCNKNSNILMDPSKNP